MHSLGMQHTTGGGVQGKHPAQHPAGVPLRGHAAASTAGRPAATPRRFTRKSTHVQAHTPACSPGAPAATAASRTMRAASTVHLAARGWGQRMSAFRVFSASSDLKMAVEVGLVQGTMPARGCSKFDGASEGQRRPGVHTMHATIAAPHAQVCQPDRRTPRSHPPALPHPVLQSGERSVWNKLCL